MRIMNFIVGGDIHRARDMIGIGIGRNMGVRRLHFEVERMRIGRRRGVRRMKLWRKGCLHSKNKGGEKGEEEVAEQGERREGWGGVLEEQKRYNSIEGAMWDVCVRASLKRSTQASYVCISVGLLNDNRQMTGPQCQTALNAWMVDSR